MGPDTYDLASLLRDAYVELDAAEVDGLLTHYRTVAGVRDGGALRRRFVRTTVQRALKALGTFGFQITVRGNSRYQRRASPHALLRPGRHRSRTGTDVGSASCSGPVLEESAS